MRIDGGRLRLAAGWLVALVATGASAQTAEYGGSTPAVTASLTVRASVAVSCGFSPGAAPGGDRAVGDVSKPFSADFQFALRCNTPARVAVVSLNGGLLADLPGAAAPGYSKLAGYTVELKLVGDGGVTAVDSCVSAALAAGAAQTCGFRGPSTSASGLQLTAMSTDAPGSYLRVSSAGAPATPILLASNAYADRLTVTISPAI